jgi:hypothetical protein|eukprot:Tamp_08721.p1 GENE.Tamp_08721~~Tamp_08721.p1  ORF type:complete len:461 (+),score=19.24 Tamp_08721:50-1432(+)
MHHDIFLSLAVEKIRIDFGDLIASIYRTISMKNNCFLSQLVYLFPHVSYHSIRASILTLFQFNLIVLENFYSFENINGEKIHSTKLSTILSEAVTRIRYPRFIALIEMDYGLYGASVLKFLLKNGQIYLSSLIKNYPVKSGEKIKIVEDILIHMARDKLIIQANTLSTRNKIITSCPGKNVSTIFFLKPNFRSLWSSWRIFTQTFNLRLKLNTWFSLLQEYQNFQTKYLIKFYMSKLLSIKTSFVYNIWVSIDSFSDFCKDGLTELNQSEKFIFDSFDNLCFVNQFIKLKNGFFKINLIHIEIFFRGKIIENLILNQFGKKFGLVFKIMMGKKFFEENELSEKSGINKSRIKTILYNMHRLGFVYMEDNKIFRKDSKVPRLWKLDLTFTSKKIFLTTTKSLYNLLLRLENYSWVIKKILDKTQTDNFHIIKKKRGAILDKIDTLLGSLMRVDEILNLIFL